MKESYNPYEGGRWYKFFIESDGTTVTLTSSDIPGATAGANLTLPYGYAICQRHFEIHSEDVAVEGPCDWLYIAADGKQFVTLPAASNYDYMTVYLFCKKLD